MPRRQTDTAVSTEGADPSGLSHSLTPEIALTTCRPPLPDGLREPMEANAPPPKPVHRVQLPGGAVPTDCASSRQHVDGCCLLQRSPKRRSRPRATWNLPQVPYHSLHATQISRSEPNLPFRIPRCFFSPFSGSADNNKAQPQSIIPSYSFTF